MATPQRSSTATLRSSFSQRCGGLPTRDAPFLASIAECGTRKRFNLWLLFAIPLNPLPLSTKGLSRAARRASDDRCFQNAGPSSGRNCAHAME
jgi:hypothetical protein